jgi:hypothetical protein
MTLGLIRRRGQKKDGREERRGKEEATQAERERQMGHGGDRYRENGRKKIER